MTTDNDTEKEATEQAAEELDQFNNRERDVPVTYKSGNTAHIRLRRCGISSIGRLDEAMRSGDDVRAIQICLCDPVRRDQPLDEFHRFINSMTEDSQFDLIERVEEINGPNLERHRKRMAKRQKLQFDQMKENGVDILSIAEKYMEQEGAARASSGSSAGSSEGIPA